MKPSYSKSSVEPITVSKNADSTLSVRFNEPLESMFYAAGIDYEVANDVMRVVITRCSIRGECNVMVRRRMPPDPQGGAEVIVPLKAGKVMMVFADGEEQIHP